MFTIDAENQIYFMQVKEKRHAFSERKTCLIEHELDRRQPDYSRNPAALLT